MKPQRMILPGKRRSNNVVYLTFDEHGKPFYNSGIVEMVDFLWEYEKYSELKRWKDNVKRNRIVLYISKSQRPWMHKKIKSCDTWFSLKDALIKGVVEVEEKINKV
ncbi:hypothetical protein F8M41_025473 [Gigaspora margarita]|uniref:Uncharacterized protein n=1 Tax=Gigaspora margarita TaxID=4874 RepID=A0A8H4AB12_GIGMA|nr:hypothetical protein F8M41_025473 [Gigaspora margarita]